ncbi:S-layer homology domain-containing protein [Paenibacillus sp. MMS20-IR301]|uniref:S-layer homology domain-containing protein n=1 Tax=Paenibacillus sp. MMS20-IR301 TaxID=2895946 RepID=UPI0028E7DBC0|nr:S-layer homology domain-containing protein [Paenibacillus sp. MMS20-IR301]WNS41792.1 S-layer homology domain-containing protein [Paenibacillus sp. MMS20-IR301]
MKLSSQCRRPLSLFLAVALLLTGIFPGLSAGSGIAAAEPIITADTGVTQAPPVTASPASGSKIGTGSTITLSTPVTASVYYSVYANGSITAEVADQLYTAPITVDSSYTSLTIKAYSSLPDLGNGPTATLQYSVVPAENNLKISQIQGAGHTSPYVNTMVVNVKGIVTFIKDADNFYIQSAAADMDNDIKTSEAILVYQKGGGNAVKTGDAVAVDGTVKEYGFSGQLTTTEIAATKTAVLSSGNTLPAATLIGTGGRIIPHTVIDDDNFAKFEPDKDAIDFYESLEGMRLELTRPTTVGPAVYYASSSTFEIPVVTVNGTANTTEVTSAAGGLVLTGADYNPQRLILSAKTAPVLNTGQQFAGNITGILTYDYGKFLVSAESETLPAVSPSKLVREVTSLKPEGSKLNIASFNIENFSQHNDPSKIENVARDIVINLKTPDIIGLTEVQDNDGTGTGGTDASENYEVLIAAIAAIDGGASDYGYTDIAPENNKDGGVENGNIRSGFLYNKNRVSLKPGTPGTATEAVSYSAASGLSLNPGRISPEDDAFIKSRKPLAAEFTFQGKDIIVIANHFNSKSSDNYLFGSVQPPVFTTEVQRAKIARVVNSFVEDVLQENADANVVVLGDLNDFQFSNTLNILKGSALTNLVNTLPLNERYSYVFQGNSQTLDHILVNNKLASASTLDIVHINADFADPGDYPKGTEFPAGGIRISDHDPLLAQIDFGTTDFNLRVLHTNDTHGHLENVAKRTSATSSERTGNTVLLDAGDVFSGTLYFNQFKGQADIKFMNNIGYDAMTFGNHEFDMNKENPEVLKNFVTAAQFPFASSNIDFTTNNSELADLYHEMTGILATDEAKSTAKDGNIYPSVIKDVYGEKIGIFGLTTEDTVGLASPGDKIIFKDHIESAKKTVKALEDQGINKIIAVTHLGYTVDQELAKAVPGIDIIVGGHSHTKVDNPPTPIINVGTDKKVLIVQTGEYSQFLGELDVTFDKNGDIKAYKGKLLDVNLFGEDAVAKSILAPIDAELATVRNTVVGYSNVDLYTHLNSQRVVRKQETPIGNMIADSIAEKVTELMPSFVSEADRAAIKGVVAIQNGGGIREAINVGDITMGEVLTTLPFGNGLAALKVTGAEIISSLENSVSGLASDQGRFAHVSGMRYTYDSTKKPEIIDSLSGAVTQAGERIVSVEIKQADGSYLPVDPKAYYILSTNSFMAGGGDFYRALASAKADGRYYELGLPDFEVLLAYLKKHNPVTSSIEGRITDLKGATPSPTPTTTPAPTSAPGGSGTITPAATPSPGPSATATAAVPAQVTTITAADLTAQLAALPAGSNELVIPLTASAGGAQVILPGSVLVQQAAANPGTVLTFNSTGGASYSLPLSIINAAALTAQLGTSDFTITVSILQADAATLSSISTAIAAQAGSVTLAAPVIEFTVTAQAGNNSVSLNSFGSTYVERSITAAGSLSSQGATAVSYDPATGKLSFVPSVFSSATSGNTEVTIKRNSNSYYTVVKSSKTFSDTAGHWAQSAIELLASKLIITGTSSTAFSPSQSITRAEFAALITRSLGLASASGGTTFSDVSSAAWYADSVQTAAAAGLITGYTDGSFKPGSPITRQEMAAVLSKAMKYTGKSLTADPAVLAKFRDAASIPDWSKAAVAEVAAEGIIQGTPDGSFAPAKLATRAEAATMLEKTLKSLQFIN